MSPRAGAGSSSVPGTCRAPAPHTAPSTEQPREKQAYAAKARRLHSASAAMKRSLLHALISTVALSGFAGLALHCGGDEAKPADPIPDDPDGSAPPPPTPAPIGKRPSKSGTIAITDDDAVVAMVNPEEGTVSFFKTEDNSRIANVKTGRLPSAVVLSSDNKTAFVANRADATVVKVSGIDTPTPTVSAPVPVGSEPTGLAPPRRRPSSSSPSSPKGR